MFDADGMDAGLDGGICADISQGQFGLSSVIPLQGAAFTFVSYSVH